MKFSHVVSLFSGVVVDLKTAVMYCMSLFSNCSSLSLMYCSICIWSTCMARSIGCEVSVVFVSLAAKVMGVIVFVALSLSLSSPGKSCAVYSLGFLGDGSLCCVFSGVCFGADGGGMSLGYRGHFI